MINLRSFLSDSETRIDIFLTEALSCQRAYAKTLIQNGCVSVNGKPILKPSTKLVKNDRVEVSMPDEIIVPPPADVPMKLPDMLYEDKDILVIHKAVGVVVHPGIKNDENTLVQILSSYTTLAPGSDPSRPGIVHRLDKDTAGIMVIAKSQRAYEALVNQFKAKTVIKKYIAMVRGDVSGDDIVIDRAIARDPHNPLKMRTFPAGRGREAVSIVKVLRRYQTKTVVEVQPITGRTHQIRVHLAHIGHSVIGDPLYGPRLKSATGQLLHAYFLSFEHPIKQQRWSFEVPCNLK
jgi:23S rRNA pseudouridine1911/1915/1917 synthase